MFPSGFFLFKLTLIVLGIVVHLMRLQKDKETSEKALGLVLLWLVATCGMIIFDTEGRYPHFSSSKEYLNIPDFFILTGQDLLFLICVLYVTLVLCASYFGLFPKMTEDRDTHTDCAICILALMVFILL